MENTPPLPQPWPHTCPNCGAGLETLPEFCSHCGASLQKPNAARVPLGFANGLLFTLGLLFFGMMGSCGGLFVYPTFTTITDSHDHGLASAFLIFGAPSLLVGVTGFIWCLKRLIRGRKG